jgi:hypothetical protein
MISLVSSLSSKPIIHRQNSEEHGQTSLKSKIELHHACQDRPIPGRKSIRTDRRGAHMLWYMQDVDGVILNITAHFAVVCMAVSESENVP